MLGGLFIGVRPTGQVTVSPWAGGDFQTKWQTIRVKAARQYCWRPKQVG
jgi:hypothetical protein